VADSADSSLHDLKGQLRAFAVAVAQVGRTGSRQEVEAVGAILDDARRRIYLLLADGVAGPDRHPGGRSADGGDAGTGDAGGEA
jgi:hypothetical protein